MSGKPRKRQTKESEHAARSFQRRFDAFEMRAQGVTYQEIANTLKYASRGAAVNAVRIERERRERVAALPPEDRAALQRDSDEAMLNRLVQLRDLLIALAQGETDLRFDVEAKIEHYRQLLNLE
jgi:ribosomal protein L15E